MTDLLPAAKDFAQNLAKDAVNFPATKASWPVFKEALVTFYNDVKRDMFHFRSDVLNPLVTDAVAKRAETLKLPATPDKAEQLLTLKEDTNAKFSALSAQSEKKVPYGFAATGIFLVAGIVFGPGVFIAALPLVAAAFKYGTNEQGVNDRKRALVDKMDRDVIALATGEERAAVFASPKFQERIIERGLLKKAFTGAGWGSTKDEQFDAVVAKLPQSALKVEAAPSV